MEKRILFRHMTSQDGRRFTVAGWFDELGINVGISLCGDQEQFQRSVGRNKAAGRSLATATSKGRSYIVLNNTPSEEKFWKGIEIKVFNDGISKYERMTSKELKKEFYLHK